MHDTCHILVNAQTNTASPYAADYVDAGSNTPLAAASNLTPAVTTHDLAAGALRSGRHIPGARGRPCSKTGYHTYQSFLHVSSYAMSNTLLLASESAGGRPCYASVCPTYLSFGPIYYTLPSF